MRTKKKVVKTSAKHVFSFEEVYTSRSTSFWYTLTIKYSKNISLIRGIDWRALHGRARTCARAKSAHQSIIIISKLQKIGFSTIFLVVQRARQFGKWHHMFMIKEMIFNYFVGGGTRNSLEIEFDENHEKTTKKKWKIDFSWFSSNSISANCLKQH